MTLKTIFCFILIAQFSLSQKTQAYQIFNSKGKKVSFEKMMKSLTDQDYIFFGEYHDNPIDHWLQYELLLDLHEVYEEDLILGFEMFEQDQQALLDSFMRDDISEKAFEEQCRLWPNYSTDYKPLINYSKENQLKVIADNIPRRYASMLFKKGRASLDSLSAEEKSWIVPLDFKVDTTLSQYVVIKEMAMHGGMENMVEAQAIKDATMAYFLMKNKEDNECAIHFNGAFHSDFFQGIIWYIEQQQPNSRIKTISTVSQADVSKLLEENIGKADFIICVDENMTSTH